LLVYEQRCLFTNACIGARSRLHNTVHRLPSSCCAAFALGTTSGTACPATYGQLDNAVACKSAADAASKTYGRTVAYSYYPYGCYWHTITGSVYYNANAAGAANFYAQPLCAGAASKAHQHGQTLRWRLARLDAAQVRRQRRRRSALQEVSVTVSRARSVAAARCVALG
jgi:hypothetical protein